jgi:inhibitor of KinA
MKSDRYALKYHQFNENSILVEWPKEISQDILEDLTHFKSKIEKSESSPYIDQAVSAYQSLLVQY